MKSGKLVIVCLVFIFAIFIIPKAYSDGIIIPPPEVEVSIKYHKVDVSIDNQIATTRVDQVFINHSPMQIEATYIFPLPEGVTISEFIMYDESGNPLKAELLDSKKAREIYEEIVRSRRDPAILEYMGTGAFRARIFPIFPFGEKRIQLEYSEILTYDAGIYKYKYPLNTEKFSLKPLEVVEVLIDLKSRIPIKSLWSPTHEDKIIVNRVGENSARIIYADEDIRPERDFDLYYTVSDDELGLNLMTYKDTLEDGFYVLMVAPNFEIPSTQAMSKNVIFVFDTSGSMAKDDKIGQAKEALEFCVRKLNRQDTFNIIDFSTGIRKFKLAPINASSEGIQLALKYINDFEATGATDINGALLEALKQASLADSPVNMIIFLTDGKPSIGVQDRDSILANVRKANRIKARLFVFGVGYDVNTHLLDALAEENGGVTAYVRPDEDIEIAVSSFFAKVSNPVLSDLVLDFSSINTYDTYPVRLPDLFAGSQLKVFGRYRNSGNTTLKLTGTTGGKTQSFTYRAEFPAENTSNKFIPSIWAARKVGYLSEQVREKVRLGEDTSELVDEIKELSIKYGVVNDYISMLILEDETLPPVPFEMQFAADSGKDAIGVSNAVRWAKDASVVASGTQGDNMKVIESKIFIKKGDVWVDAEYKDQAPTINIEYASSIYFSLLAQYPELGKYFALGKNVTVYYNGEIYQIQEKPVESIKGDLNGDGVVDLFDLIIVVRNFGTNTEYADVNGDGKVDMVDLILVARYFGMKKMDSKDDSSAPPARSGKVKVSLSTEMINPDSLVMSVYADPVDDISGFQMDLSFDPDLLEAVKMDEGNALSGNASRTYWIPPNISNEAGRIIGAACVKLDTGKPGKDGGLAYVTFRLKTQDFSKARSTIRLDGIKIADLQAHPVAVEIDNMKGELSKPQLWQNYPNPFNPDTWIPYRLSEGSVVKVKIYDITGKIVREIDLGHKLAGVYATKDKAVYWDGKNSYGEGVSSGIYFCVLEAGNFTFTKKMTLRK